MNHFRLAISRNLGPKAKAGGIVRLETAYPEGNSSRRQHIRQSGWFLGPLGDLENACQSR
jgi:hypothetical protein